MLGWRRALAWDAADAVPAVRCDGWAVQSGEPDCNLKTPGCGLRFGAHVEEEQMQREDSPGRDTMRPATLFHERPASCATASRRQPPALGSGGGGGGGFRSTRVAVCVRVLQEGDLLFFGIVGGWICRMWRR